MKRLTIEEMEKISSSYGDELLKDRFASASHYDKFLPSYGIPNISCRKNLRVLYGRVSSKNGSPVVLREEYLTQLNVDGAHFVLDIVAECFNEMVDYHEKLMVRGKLYKDNTLFSKLMVEEAYVPPFSLYQRYYRETLHPHLFEKMTQHTKYSDFERQAISVLRDMATSTPVTLSEFIINKSVSPSISGLVINLQTSKFDDDQTKYKKYLGDRNYPLFKKIAKRFGFVIDEDAPWRLYFNLDSPYSIGKMTERGILDINQFFDRYYQETIELD